jgi:hypothetical protein
MKEQFEDIAEAFYKDAATLQSEMQLQAVHANQALRTAYRMAARYERMVSWEDNKLLEHVRTRGFNGHDCIARWSEKYFSPLLVIGVPIRELVDAVKAGMTEAEYIAAGRVTLRRLVRKQIKRGPRSLHADEPPPDAPAAVQITYWREKARTSEQEAKSLRTIIRRLKRRVIQIESDLGITGTAS